MCIWPQASDTRLNSEVKSLVSLWKKTDLIEYCTSTVCLSLPHTHTQFLHVQSPQGTQMIFPHSQSARACLRMWTQWLRDRPKHYYHIIRVIRALFGGTCCDEGALGSVLERHSFSDRAFIYLQYIVPSFPHASPLCGGLSKPSVDASTAERMRCSGEQEGKKARKRNIAWETIDRFNTCCIS